MVWFRQACLALVRRLFTTGRSQPLSDAEPASYAAAIGTRLFLEEESQPACAHLT